MDLVNGICNTAGNALFLLKDIGLNQITGSQGLQESVKEQVVAVVGDSMVGARSLTFVRVAGLSGALAIGFGAYGAHVFREKEKSAELKHVFDTGSRYHYIHTLALLASPITNRPILVGSLITTGMVLFSGSCYYHALTGNTKVRMVTPYGGIVLILGWLAMIL